MKAKDVMEPVEDYLTPENTLKEAIKKMKTARRAEGILGVKGMLVLDREGNLVGMLSIHEVLKAMIPPYMQLCELGGFTWNGMLEETARRIANKKVEEIMLKEIITVPEDAPLMECASIMVKRYLHRIPVVNKEGRVVGIVYVRDLYNAIVEAMFGKEEK